MHAVTERVTAAVRNAEVVVQNATTRARESLKGASAVVCVCVDSIQVDCLPSDKVSGFYCAVAVAGTSERFVSSPFTSTPGKFVPSPSEFHLSVAMTDTLCLELWGTANTLGGVDVLLGKACMPVTQLATVASASTKAVDLSLKVGPDIEAITLLGPVKAIAGTSASYRVRFDLSPSPSTTTAAQPAHTSLECGNGKPCVVAASTAPSQIRTPAPQP